MERDLKVIAGMAAFVLVGLGGFTLGAYMAADSDALTIFGSSDDGFDAVEEAFNEIRERSVNPPSETDLARAAIEAMLEEVKKSDDYALYYDQKDFQTFLDYSSGSFSGIGVTMSEGTNRLTILSVIPGTPADEAGLRRGDVLQTVDGRPVSEMTSEEAIGRVKGPAGTEVSITVLRDGEEIGFDLTRAEIAFPNLRGRLVQGDIGYVQLYTFAGGAGSDLRDKVEELRAAGARGIVLDLRDNGGGLLSEAIEVASVFIEEGEIVTYREESSEDLVYEAEGDAFEELPVVVLVNGGTASASEIAANALQDRGRGKLVGTTTFGKGSVQEIIDLPDQSAVKLTTGTYLSPDGEDINGSGIEPDIVVEGSRAEQKRRAFAVLDHMADSGSSSQG